jgi:hypothetical protein
VLGLRSSAHPPKRRRKQAASGRTWSRPCELLHPAAVRVEAMREEHTAHLRHSHQGLFLAFWRARAADRAGTVHWAAAGRVLASSDSAVHLAASASSCCGEARPEAVVLKGSGTGRASWGQGRSRRWRALHTRARSHTRQTVRLCRRSTLSSPSYSRALPDPPMFEKDFI